MLQELKQFDKDIEFQHKSLNNIIEDQKLYKSLMDKYIGLTMVQWRYKTVSERYEKWNKEIAQSFNEYFDNDFYNFKFIGDELYSYDSKEDKRYEKNLVGNIFNLLMYKNDLKNDTISSSMIRFNQFIDTSVEEQNKALEKSKNVYALLEGELAEETKRLEQPNIYVYGIIISKAIIVVFLLLLIQILI